MARLSARSSWLLALCGLLAARQAAASLMAIDLGSEYLRAVLVKPTARGSPLQIVSNEMSRRKSPALVGIAGEERLLGEEAFSFSIRYPTTVFSRTRDLLGRSAGDAFVQNLLAADRLPYQLSDHPERGTVMAKVNDTTAFLVEELVVSGAAARSTLRAPRHARCPPSPARRDTCPAKRSQRRGSGPL